MNVNSQKRLRDSTAKISYFGKQRDVAHIGNTEGKKTYLYTRKAIVMMDTMEDTIDNNTGDFKPTEELGDLAFNAAEKAFGENKIWASVKKHAHFDSDTISEIFEGTWTVKNDYIRLLSLCIRTIRPKKVKLKRLPNTLPNRDVMESLEKGLEKDLLLYKKAITVLCMMPDLPPKKHNTRKSISISG